MSSRATRNEVGNGCDQRIQRLPGEWRRDRGRRDEQDRADHEAVDHVEEPGAAEDEIADERAPDQGICDPKRADLLASRCATEKEEVHKDHRGCDRRQPPFSSDSS
jgi:hypothetical protein